MAIARRAAIDATQLQTQTLGACGDPATDTNIGARICCDVHGVADEWDDMKSTSDA